MLGGVEEERALPTFSVADMSKRIHEAFAQVQNSDLKEQAPDPLFVSPPEEVLWQAAGRGQQLSSRQRQSVEDRLLAIGHAYQNRKALLHRQS